MGEPMDRSRRVFGSLKPFDDVFPDIEGADVEYTETGEFAMKARTWLYHRSAEDEQPQTHYHSVRHGGLIRCSNPLCRRGGYEIDAVLAEMKRLGETERSGSLSCPGDEGSPKGRRRGDRCRNQIQYTLTVRYRKPDAESMKQSV
jgi:hypothetical protein